MKTCRLVLSIIAIALCAARGAAQTDAQLTQFYEVPTFYNPAAVGSTEQLKLRAAGRLQWVGIEKAPQTYLITADTRLKLLNKWLGVGVVAMTESAGLYSTITASAQIAFKLKLLGGMLTIGVQPGMLNEKFKGSELFIPDDDSYHQSTDEALPNSDVGGTAFDMGAGLWFDHKFWHAGVSMQHALSPTVKFNASNSSSSTAGGGEDQKVHSFQALRTLYFIAGGNIPIKNTLFELMPSLMVYSDFTFTGGEIMARARYNKFLTAGIGYRYNDALSVTVAAEIKGFFIGYSFDWALSSISSHSYGSHEIVAGYSIKLDFSEKNRNRHKNIRIL